MEPVHILSLGAGVQSSTLALMAAAGEVTPMPTAAIFADTQAEPASVYRWLEWLTPKLPFPVHRVTKGNLGEAALRVRTSKAGNKYSQHSIPAFIESNGRAALMMRHCTRDFKLDVILREVRRIRGKAPVIQWIGISRDEIQRMKPSRLPYVTHRWPLVDMGMTRVACLQWMEHRGFPKPPRSACVFCPYHSNAEWQRLKTEEPEAFAAAVKFESAFQVTAAQVGEWRGVPFLHRSLKPLGEIDFSPDDSQPELWGNECDGICNS